jgi:hypothetical protein
MEFDSEIYDGCFEPPVPEASNRSTWCTENVPLQHAHETKQYTGFDAGIAQQIVHK